MRLKLKDKLSNVVRDNQSGRTLDQKEAAYCRLDFNYRKSLEKVSGKIVTVDIEFLFEDQFNIIVEKENLRIMGYMVESIDVTPEFKNRSELIKAVKKRYKRDWPGSIITGKYLRSLKTLKK